MAEKPGEEDEASGVGQEGLSPLLPQIEEDDEDGVAPLEEA